MYSLGASAEVEGEECEERFETCERNKESGAESVRWKEVGVLSSRGIWRVE